MRRSIRFIQAGLELAAVVATAMVILYFGSSARTALWSSLASTEVKELRRSVLFLENLLNDRLVYFKAYADDVLSDRSVRSEERRVG